VPDARKRELADYIVDTSKGMEPARQAVAAIIADLRGKTGAGKTS
jgi:dephospho-CoA kinase